MAAPRSLLARCLICISAITVLCLGCGEKSQIKRTLDAVGAPKLRKEAISTYRGQLPKEGAFKLAETTWPPSVRAFRPLSVWAESDGIYLLLDSNAGGERGVYLPPVVPEKDPICTISLKHVKLADGVYWYDRSR